MGNIPRQIAFNFDESGNVFLTNVSSNPYRELRKRQDQLEDAYLTAKEAHLGFDVNIIREYINFAYRMGGQYGLGKDSNLYGYALQSASFWKRVLRREVDDRNLPDELAENLDQAPLYRPRKK